MEETLTSDGPTIATPLTSPLGLNSWIPTGLVPLGTGMRGPALDTGVGSVTSIFIWTIPPGGADSSGICSEIWRVAVEHEPPLVDPLVVVVEPPLVDPDPPLVDPEVLCARTPWGSTRMKTRTTQAKR